MQSVWSQNDFVNDRTVDQLVKRLRQALNEKGLGDWIQTVRGFGYKLHGQ